MQRRAHLLFLAVWLLGAVTAGLTVPPKAPGQSPRLVATTDLATLAVHDDQVVLTVDLSDRTQWRIAAPTPTYLSDWLRESASPPSHKASRDQTGSPFVSLLILPALLLS